MTYLNEEVLAGISESEFQQQRPFPWMNPHGILSDWGFDDLVAHMPDIVFFEKDFGAARKYGQPSHDRYRLWYDKAKGNLPPSWQAFIRELNGPGYHQFIARCLGVKEFDLRLEWHYSVGGCSVSPHLDGFSTLAAHLFYFNPPHEWDPAWGGQTLILDQGAREFGMESNPRFDDFKKIIVTNCIGNYSVLFKNQLNAFHGVKELQSPPGTFRKMFTVFIEKREPLAHRSVAKIKNFLRPIRDAVLARKKI